MTNLFPNGTFRGEGRWVDQKTEGRYRTRYTIAGGDGAKVHRVERDFLKPDGTLAYEERTTVTFRPQDREGMRVSISGPHGTVEGSGYALGDYRHYDIDVSTDNHLEFTFHLDGARIVGLGSATNKGNRTYWEESLERV